MVTLEKTNEMQELNESAPGFLLILKKLPAFDLDRSSILCEKDDLERMDG